MPLPRSQLSTLLRALSSKGSGSGKHHQLYRHAVAGKICHALGLCTCTGAADEIRYVVQFGVSAESVRLAKNLQEFDASARDAVIAQHPFSILSERAMCQVPAGPAG